MRLVVQVAKNGKVTNEKRLAEMVRLRKKGLTMAELGKHFGVSGQRIAQLSFKLSPEEKELFRRSPKKTYTFNCLQCHTEITTDREEQKFCTRDCSDLYRRIYPSKAAYHEAHKKQSRDRYRNDAEYRARHAEYMKNWLIELKKDRAKYRAFREKQDAYWKEWNKRRREDKAAGV